VRHPQWWLVWVTGVDQLGGSLFVVCPGNDDVGGSFNFEERHRSRAFLDFAVQESPTPKR
jgi:hypothetical protein